MRGFIPLGFIFVIGFVSIVGGIVYSVYEESKCVEWKETGRIVCNGDGNHFVCEPQKQCSKYEDK